MTEVEATRARPSDFPTACCRDRFRWPLTLAMDVPAEAGKLVETCQWLTEKRNRSPSLETMTGAGKKEVADVSGT